jgi:hypothetical protein
MSEFQEEKILHCKRCGEHWPVDDYESEYNKKLSVCPECGPQYTEEVEECLSGEANCGLSIPEAVMANDFLASEFVRADGGTGYKIRWNSLSIDDLGVVTPDNYILIAIGYDSKAKDAKTGLFICPDGRLKAAEGKNSSACLPWFKEFVTPGPGSRANISEYSKVMAAFRAENKKYDPKLTTIVAPSIKDLVTEYGHDVVGGGGSGGGGGTRPSYANLAKEYEDLRKNTVSAADYEELKKRVDEMTKSREA